MSKWIANMKFDCRFVFSRLPLRLQHRAVELAYENSLEHFLFPTSATVCRRTNPIIPLDQLSDIKYVKQVCIFVGLFSVILGERAEFNVPLDTFRKSFLRQSFQVFCCVGTSSQPRRYQEKMHQKLLKLSLRQRKLSLLRETHSQKCKLKNLNQHVLIKNLWYRCAYDWVHTCTPPHTHCSNGQFQVQCHISSTLVHWPSSTADYCAYMKQMRRPSTGWQHMAPNIRQQKQPGCQCCKHLPPK